MLKILFCVRIMYSYFKNVVLFKKGKNDCAGKRIRIYKIHVYVFSNRRKIECFETPVSRNTYYQTASWFSISIYDAPDNNNNNHNIRCTCLLFTCACMHGLPLEIPARDGWEIHRVYIVPLNFECRIPRRAA